MKIWQFLTFCYWKWWFSIEIVNLPIVSMVIFHSYVSWLVVWNMNFSFSEKTWDNPSHWRTHIFQDGWNHQPEINGIWWGYCRNMIGIWDYMEDSIVYYDFTFLDLYNGIQSGWIWSCRHRDVTGMVITVEGAVQKCEARQEQMKTPSKHTDRWVS